jgi:hypothetical protein
LTIAKRTHLPARSDGIDSDRIDSNRTTAIKVELRFKILKFHTLGKRNVTESKTNPMERVGRCRDDARSSIFGDDARSSMLEIDGLAVDWAVDGMRRKRREREGRDRVNSRFFEIEF